MGLSIAPAMALNGWIILDKAVGMGSTQAVGAVKRALREAGEPKTKVGHEFRESRPLEPLPGQIGFTPNGQRAGTKESLLCLLSLPR